MREQPVLLLVDDTQAGLDTLEALLLSEKYQLEFARSGPEAISKAVEFTPDLILLDVMMPGMDGFETCRRLRTNPSLAEVPVVMVTALDDRESRLEGIQAGADDFFTKPFDRAELRARVHTIIRLNRYRNLLSERSRYEKLIELSPDGVIITDPDGIIHLANPAALAIAGLSNTGSLVGTSLFDLVTRNDIRDCYTRFSSLVAGEAATITVETQFDHEDQPGRYVELRASMLEWENTPNVQIIARDITERKSMEASLEYMAWHDILTGLPNHNLLLDRLKQSLALARREESQVGIVHIMIDNFHTINQTLGRDVGDEVIKEVAVRFQNNIRESDTLARISGAEFVWILNNIYDERSLSLAVNNLKSKLVPPVSLKGQEFYLELSAGICIYPMDGENAPDLLRNAAIALSYQQDGEKGTIQHFETSMSERVMDKLRMTHRLRKGIEQGELVLYYQPQIDLATSRLAGVEALVRWIHPEIGLVPPNQFIALAEESGLIYALGDWVAKEACSQWVKWREAGLSPFRVAFNISSVQFHQSSFIEKLLQIINQSGVDPKFLGVEITESLFVRNLDDMSTRLQPLRDLGIQVDLDDFGTGYSSLSYLKKLPIDTIKIDKSFIDDLSHGTQADYGHNAFVKAIVAMGHSLQLKVLAEGVETQGQLACLQELGVEQVQGYYYGRPMLPDQLVAWREKTQH